MACFLTQLMSRFCWVELRVEKLVPQSGVVGQGSWGSKTRYVRVESWGEKHELNWTIVCKWRDKSARKRCWIERLGSEVDKRRWNRGKVSQLGGVVGTKVRRIQLSGHVLAIECISLFLERNPSAMPRSPKSEWHDGQRRLVKWNAYRRGVHIVFSDV